MGLNLVHLFGHLAWPVMPSAAHASMARSSRRRRSSPGRASRWPNFLDQLDAGQPIRVPDVLFAKITDEQIADWKARFGGGD